MPDPTPLTPAEEALGRALVARGLARPEAVRAAALGRAPGQPLGDALVARGVVDPRALATLAPRPLEPAAPSSGADAGGPTRWGDEGPGAPWTPAAPGGAGAHAGPTSAGAPGLAATRGDAAFAPGPATGDALAGATRWSGEAPAAGGAPADATRWVGEALADPTGQAPDLSRTRWDGPAPAAPAPAPDLTRMTWDGPALPASASPTAPRAGALARDYELLGELGRGGMGVVYRARERASGREVAVKRLLAASAGRTAIERFLREGQVTAGLRHPNIVTVHAAGEVDGDPFLVFELVAGARTLADVTPGLGLRERVGYARDAARALGVAHRAGVVHRDVKPANLLVDAAGTLKVADFGLAAGEALERLTQTGAQLGTPAYMAPEQVDGDRAAQGPPTDVWALGVVLYELLTGRRPFEAPSFAQLSVQICKAAPARPRALDAAIPADLEAVCLRCLAAVPADRYPHGEALARDLERFLAGEPVQGGLRPRGRRARAALAAVLAASTLGALVLASTGLSRGGGADLVAVEAALEAAQAARSDGSLPGLRREVAALRAAVRAAGASEAARARLAAGGLDGRRRAVLPLLVERLLEARAGGATGGLLAPDPAAEAVEAARELCGLSPEPAARLLLARALLAAPGGGAEGIALAEALAEEATEEVAGPAAALLLDAGRPAAAARALREAPPALRRLRGRARLEAGDLAGAAADLEGGREEDATDLELALDRAALALARGDAQGALSALEALRQGGGLARWHGLRAAALEALDRPAAARAALDQAARLDARWGPALPRLLLRRGRGRTALAAFDAAAGGEAAGGEAAGGAAAGGAASGGDASGGARGPEPGAALDRALAAWALGGDDAALEAAAAAAVDAGDDARAPAALAARALVTAGWVALARDDQAAAARSAGAATAATPEAPAVLALAGEVALRAGDAAALERAIAGLEARAASLRTVVPSGAAPPLEAAAAARVAAALRARGGLGPGTSGAPGSTTAPPPIEAADLALARARAEAGPAAVGRAPPEHPVLRAAEAAQAARLAPPGPGPWPLPVASAGAPWTATELAASLAAAARREVVAGLLGGDAAARARLERLARRALALDPSHADAALWLARAAGADDPRGALAPLDALVARHADLALARRARLTWLEANGLEPERWPDDAAALVASGLATPEDRFILAWSHAQGDRADAAWAALATLAPADVRDREPLGELVIRLGKSRPDGAHLVEAAREARKARLDVVFRLDRAWAVPDRAHMEEATRHLPRDDRYWAWSAGYELAKLQDVLAAHLSLARYLLAVGPKRPQHVHSVRHTPALAPILQGTLFTRADAAVALRPADATVRLASASLRMSRARAGAADAAGRGRDEGALEDVERAADLALSAWSLEPLRAGVALFAADLLAEVDALEDAEDLLAAAAALDARHRGELRPLSALDLGPRLVRYAEPVRAHDALECFVTARVAAARGDAGRAAQALARIHRNEASHLDDDGPTGRTAYVLEQDPLLGRYAAQLREALDPTRRR